MSFTNGSHMSGIDSVLADSSSISPQHLALMKLDAESDGDVFSDTVTPLRASHSYRGASAGGALTRTSRRQSGSVSRRTSAFMASHRSKMALELSTQAEAKFSAFMEFMASASKEASSFKEYWSKLLVERESFEQEREELLARVDEVTETLELNQKHGHDHSRELADRKRQMEKIVFELTTALTSLKDEKKHSSDRELELDHSHKELAELRTTLSRVQQDHDTARAENERLVFRVTAAETERDRAKDDTEKYRSDFRSLKREHTELRTRVNELNIQLESSSREVVNITERLRISERERDEFQFDKERLQEELRRSTIRVEESVKELTDTKDRADHLHREVSRTKESLRSVESERDEHTLLLERLRSDYKDKVAKLDESELRFTDILVKLEQSKREAGSKQDRLTVLESEILEVRRHLDSRSEEHRLIIIERDQIRDDLESSRRDATDHHRQLATLQDSLKRSESTLTEVRNEVYQANERVTLVERERDSARHKHSHLESEITSLKSRLEMVSGELKGALNHRDHARKELEDFKQSYEEVTETVSEWKDDSEALQFEIDNLRKMLLESREQKERAIAARNTADRERDEFITKYEEKCREFERYDEDRASQFHAHAQAHANGRSNTRSSTTRVFSQGSSGTQIKGSHGEGYNDSFSS